MRRSGATFRWAARCRCQTSQWRRSVRRQTWCTRVRAGAGPGAGLAHKRWGRVCIRHGRTAVVQSQGVGTLCVEDVQGMLSWPLLPAHRLPVLFHRVSKPTAQPALPCFAQPFYCVSNQPACFCPEFSLNLRSHGVQHHAQPARGARGGARRPAGAGGAAQQRGGGALPLGGAVDAGAAAPGTHARGPGCAVPAGQATCSRCQKRWLERPVSSGGWPGLCWAQGQGDAC